ncbi:MAG: hypothetical protein MZW92_15865 [Comamonadaceae bacterium]|nr:hypothetical protein [Comamonadaceae bacterium]
MPSKHTHAAEPAALAARQTRSRQGARVPGRCWTRRSTPSSSSTIGARSRSSASPRSGCSATRPRRSSAATSAT